MLGTRTNVAKYKTPQYSYAWWEKWICIGIVVLFLCIFLFLPCVLVFTQAFSEGVHGFLRVVSDPDTLSALRLSLLITVCVVPLHLIFGVTAAWCITKHHFIGKQILVSLIDLPFCVSPVVAGVVFVLIFGREGWAWPLIDPGIQLSLPWAGEVNIRIPHIIFNWPGMILATAFVTLPFIVRELMPVMQMQGREDELAAFSLGAGGGQVFWKVTLPNIRWAMVYGCLLCFARSMGEFGAVSVVSGHIRGQTITLPLRIEILNNEYSQTGAFACACILAGSGLITLLLKTFLEWRFSKFLSKGQRF